MVYTVVNMGSNDGDDEQDGVVVASDAEDNQAPKGFWSLEYELQAIKTILSSSQEWSAKVYSACKPEFFHHSTTKEIFTRIKNLMDSSRTYELPSLSFVLSDPKLSPKIQEDLKETLDDDIPIVKNQGDFDILIKQLASLAKARSLYELTHLAAKDLINSAEPTSLVKKVTDHLGQSLFSLETDDNVLTQITMGKSYNQEAEDSFNRIVNGTFEQVKIKSGFRVFDEKTGGFHRTNLVILGGTSGGGKSLLAVNLLIRQYRLGYNVVLCSYEMTDDEVMIRVLSNIAEVDMNRLQNNRLTPPETDRVTAAWREFNLLGHTNNNSYHIICPKTETTVSEIGFRVRSLKPDVLILDYINLLSSGTTGEAQWQQLGDISRSGKILANKLNCVVILLAQLDTTYNLRYSKGIKDHANFVMGWVRDETSINQRIINIKQLKARNAPLYNFDLVERFDIAQFRDEDQQDRTDWPSQDELMMMELQCQQVGLKLDPTASREFDKQKFIEENQKLLAKNESHVNNIVEEKYDIEKKEDMEIVPIENLLFSLEDAVPKEFAKLEIKACSIPLISDYPIVDDTV